MIIINKKSLTNCVPAFTNLILSDNTLSVLTDSSFKGEISNILIRPTAWKIFLKIYPSESSLSDWITETSKNREMYKGKLQKYINSKKTVDDPLGDQHTTYFKDKEMRELINLDLDRTYQELSLFHDIKIKTLLGNILFIWAKENEDLSYKQGLNDIVSLFFLAFYPYYCQNSSKASKGDLIKYSQDEASIKQYKEDIYMFFHDEEELQGDLFFIFQRMMKNGIKNLFELDTCRERKQPNYQYNKLFSDKHSIKAQKDDNTPLNSRCNYIVEVLLKEIDPALYEHFMEINMDSIIFLQRWIKCIFSREFESDDLYVLWDSIFASEEENDEANFMFIDCIALSMILNIRHGLITCDQNDCFMLLFKYPPVKSIVEIIDIALKIKQAIHKKSKGETISVGDIIEIEKEFPNAEEEFPNAEDDKDKPKKRQFFKNAVNSVGGFLKNVGGKVAEKFEKNKVQMDSVDQGFKFDKLFDRFKKK